LVLPNPAQSGLQPSERLDRGAHAGARGEAIIDDDHHLAGYL
jgi:hypothetical protein